MIFASAPCKMCIALIPLTSTGYPLWVTHTNTSSRLYIIGRCIGKPIGGRYYPY